MVVAHKMVRREVAWRAFLIGVDAADMGNIWSGIAGFFEGIGKFFSGCECKVEYHCEIYLSSLIDGSLIC